MEAGELRTIREYIVFEVGCGLGECQCAELEGALMEEILDLVLWRKEARESFARELV